MRLTCIQNLCKIYQVSNLLFNIWLNQLIDCLIVISGWNIHDIGCGNTSTVISADDTLIAWGASPTFGELGLGDLQKSSTTPREVNKLEGMKIRQTAMGYSHSMLLVNDEDEKTKIKYDKLPEFSIEA